MIIWSAYGGFHGFSRPALIGPAWFDDVHAQVFADVHGESSGMKAGLQISSAVVVLENYAMLKTALRNRDQPGKINE